MPNNPVQQAPPVEWVDLRIPTERDGGELIGLLDAPEGAGSWDEAGLVHIYWPAAMWNEQERVRVQAALCRLGDRQAADALVVEPIPSQDWNAEWAKTVRPIRIGRRVVVSPPWEQAAVEPGTIQLIIEPKLAFGTGHHATTQLLVEWLEERIRGGERVLDVGTGTGILAMVALRLGAREALGIDNDAQAIVHAHEYAQENGFGPELQLRAGLLDADTVNGGARWQIVLANIDRGGLTGMADALGALAKCGAVIYVSGLLLDQVDEMCDIFAQHGMYRSERRDRDGWSALELRAAESCEG